MPNPQAKEYFDLGVSNIEVKQFDKAAEYFRKARELDPDFLDAYINEGLSYVRLKLFDDAKDSFEQALSKDPNNLAALQNMGALMLSTKNYAKAIEYYDKYLKINQDNADVWKDIGDAIVGSIFGSVITEVIINKYKEAYRSYSESLRLNPKNYEAKKWACISLNQMGKYDEALIKKGFALLNLERYYDAEESFESAAELDPDRFEAFFYKGLKYHRMQKFNVAQEYYDKALAKGNDPAIWTNKGLICYQQGLFEESIKNYDEAEKSFLKISSSAKGNTLTESFAK